MHDAANASSDNDHLPTVGLAHTYNASHAPVSEICIAFKGQDKWSTATVTSSFTNNVPGAPTIVHLT